MPDPLLFPSRGRSNPFPLRPRTRPIKPATDLKALETDCAIAERVAAYYGAGLRREGVQVFLDFTPQRGGRFLARLDCQGYPSLAPDLVFVDPVTLASSTERNHWPPESPVMKEHGGLYLCMAGLRRNPGAPQERTIPRVVEILAQKEIAR
jgi:hypothetical protein